MASGYQVGWVWGFERLVLTIEPMTFQQSTMPSDLMIMFKINILWKVQLAGYRSEFSNACWSCFVGVSEAKEGWSKMSNNKSGRCLHRGCWHTAKVHHSVLSQICRFKLEFTISQPDEGWVTSVQTVLATSTQLSFPSTCITILSKSGRKKNFGY